MRIEILTWRSGSRRGRYAQSLQQSLLLFLLCLNARQCVHQVVSGGTLPLLYLLLDLIRFRDNSDRMGKDNELR